MCEDTRSESGYAEDLQALCGLGGIRDTVLQRSKGCARNLGYCSEGIWGMWERNALRAAINSIYGHGTLYQCLLNCISLIN